MKNIMRIKLDLFDNIFLNFYNIFQKHHFILFSKQEKESLFPLLSKIIFLQFCASLQAKRNYRANCEYNKNMKNSIF